MAGDWIKFEIATPDKPEVWQIAESLSIDPDAVVGKLLRVWAWYDQQTETGNAPSVSKMLLDRLVGVTGFCDCVISVGWMSTDGQTLTLPNFDRHNGKTAKNRALTAKRVAQHKAKSNASSNGKVTQPPLPKEENRRKEVKTLVDSVETTEEPGTSSPKCPVDQITEIYNRTLPELGCVVKMTDARRQLVRARWLQDAEHQSLEFWEKFFLHIRKSDFLMGRSKSWSASFDWIFKQSNFVKIYEGTYHKEPGA